MSKSELGESSIIVQPDLRDKQHRIIFNGKEIPIRGKDVDKKRIKRSLKNTNKLSDGTHVQYKDEERWKGENTHHKHREEKYKAEVYKDEKPKNKNDRNKQSQGRADRDSRTQDDRMQNKKVPSREERDKINPSTSELRKAILWAEILGKPVCKTRRAKRQGRK